MTVAMFSWPKKPFVPTQAVDSSSSKIQSEPPLQDSSGGSAPEVAPM